MSDLQRLGKYIIEARLGEGSFAWVYKAYEKDLDRHVAIKVLKPMWLSDPKAVARFKQEGRTMAKLHHPNIAVVYNVGEDQGHVYLAQFLVNGDTLSFKIEEEPIPWPQMMGILKQVASALDFAHEHGIVHRDVKPGNVLIDNKNRAYLGDFGLVRAAEGSASVSASTGGIIGTPAYMAPEQWESHPVSPATDVYALSCVVVEMLTGSMLFDGATPVTVMKQHLMEGPRFPAKWPEGVPDTVAEVLRRGLAEEPSERIQSAGQLVAELEKAEADRATAQLTLPWLVDDDGNVHKLKLGRNTVGRATSSDIQVKTGMISRLHAALVLDNGNVTVNDEGSTNGTFVNGAQIGADGVTLNPGDTLRTGDVTFTLNAPNGSVNAA